MRMLTRSATGVPPAVFDEPERLLDKMLQLIEEDRFTTPRIDGSWFERISQNLARTKIESARMIGVTARMSAVRGRNGEIEPALGALLESLTLVIGEIGKQCAIAQFGALLSR